MTTEPGTRSEQHLGGSNRGRRVCIVGAGIGGLTAALAFARRGAVVQVFEQAAEIREVGAGVQITPNGARVLEALGLGDDLERRGIHAQAVVPTDAVTGRAITRFDLTGQVPAYRFLHRADLIESLAQACHAAGVEIRLGVQVSKVAPNGTLTTSTGTVESDLCIGADGIHAISRSEVGAAAGSVFTGQVAWRAVICAKEAAREARIWMAPNRHVVTYPLSSDMLNIVAVQERDTWVQEGWNHRDDPANLQAAFADTCPQLRDILGRVEHTQVWGLFRHPVVSHWHTGRLAILGDAAHPTLPFLAQGANMAIEDAWVLAACCEVGIEAGSARYQALRKPRVERAIAAANANARNYHLSGVQRRIAHLGLRTLGTIAPNAFLGRMAWLYEHDVTRDQASSSTQTGT